MVVKVYISGISGNKEVKKRQQRVLMILDSKNISYTTLDITEPGKESDKEYMQQNSKARDSKHPLPPQIFNDDDYCGDYDEFDLANENDELEKFLRVPLQNGHLSGNREDDQQVPQSHEELGRIDDQLPDESTLDKFGVAIEEDYKMEEDTKKKMKVVDEEKEELGEKENDSDEPEGEE